MHLQQDLDLGSDRIADGLDERDGPYLLVVLQLVVSWTEGIELERRVARSTTFFAAAWNSSGVRSTRYQPLA